MEMKWGTQGQDNESTGSFPTKEERKIQSGNRYFRLYYRRSAIPGTRWKVETNSISVKDNATHRKELWDLQQGIIGNSRSSDQVETIFTRHVENIRNMDRSQKPEVFPRTSQIKQKTCKIVSEVARLWLYTMIYSRENEYQSRYPIKKGLGEYKRR